MFKRIFLILIFIVLFFNYLSFFVFADNDNLSVCAKSSIVYYPLTDDIIYEKNIHNKMSMASTTKIMTCIVAIENCDLSEKVNIKNEMIQVEGSSAGLQNGMVVSMEDLLYCLMLPSGNEAANVIALTLCNSLAEFAKLMNFTAEKIGMKESHFVTPSGLDDENHYTTAYDMALLTAYALDNPVFEKICSTYTYNIDCGNGQKLNLVNHNRLLKENDNCIGVKTGYTKKSGRCLVSAYRKDGAVLIIVTLNDSDDWNDHRILYDYGFNQLNKIVIKNQFSGIEVKVVGCDNVFVKPEKYYIYIPEKYKNMNFCIFLDKFYYDIKKYEIVGYLKIGIDLKNIFIPIYSTEDAVMCKKEKSLIERIEDRIYGLMRNLYE